MSENRQNLDAIKERIKSYLPMYLTAMGVNVNKQFRCINPDHQDATPSAGLVPDTNLFHCFSCHVVGDIFTAAQFLEGKPTSGRGFIQENLAYLAHRFGVDIPDMPKMTEEDLIEMETYSSYLHASMIVKSSDQSDRVKARITDLGWPRDVLAKIGIGSVKNYEDFIQRMTKHYGHKLETLERIDLASKAIFNENNLLFTVKDEHGAPVGFAARDLRYADKKIAYDKKVAEIKATGTPQEIEDQLEKLYAPVKFINTSLRNPIYQKSRRLFNFDQARKFTPPLYVFEGYGDGTTAFAGGLQNSCAIGSTSFSKDHLEVILACGVKHIIFVLDADKAGEDGTERFVKMLGECMGGHIGLRVEIIVMPEGTDDPDAYIRSFGSLKAGVAEFRKLPKMDMFGWSLRKRLKDGADPQTIAEETIPMIVNQPNYLQRMGMTTKLAQETGLDEPGLWREVLRQVDVDQMGLDEERAQLAKRTASELSKNPVAIQSILETARHKIEVLEKRKSGYDPRQIVGALEYTWERAEKNERGIELATGWEFFDTALGGIPRGEVFLSFPGKPNQGKTTMFQNLCWRLLEHNKDVRVLMHSVDDSLTAAVPRILGSRFNLPSDWFRKVGYFRNQVEDFEKIYHQARQWLQNLVEDERLILADQAILPGSLPGLETWVRTIKNKFPNDALVVMGDNFHLYDLPGYEGEPLVRQMSKFIKRMANEYRTTMLFTTELPKEALRPGVRPRMGKIKGTSGVAYDANANVGVYNDLKDMGDRATITWDGPQERVIGPGGEDCFAPRRMPVIELVIDKSKLSAFDGTLYYKLTPETGRLDECTDDEQVRYRDRANKYHNSSHEQQPTYAPHSSAF
jgi:DNA primase